MILAFSHFLWGVSWITLLGASCALLVTIFIFILGAVGNPTPFNSSFIFECVFDPASQISPPMLIPSTDSSNTPLLPS
jgi:hypothetical protein